MYNLTSGFKMILKDFTQIRKRNGLLKTIRSPETDPNLWIIDH